MFRKLYAWTLHWAGSRHATVALAAISFVESSVFPIPADVLFIPMCLARPSRVMRYALIATVTSVLGGMFGWLLGHYAFDLIARPILEADGKLGAFEALKAAAGDSAILLMLVTSGVAHMPPMKVVTILAGVISFSFPLFVLSAIMARGARRAVLPAGLALAASRRAYRGLHRAAAGLADLRSVGRPRPRLCRDKESLE